MTDITLRALLYGVDKSASSSIRGVGKEAHSMAGTVGGAFSKLGSTIGGEVGEVLDKIGAGLEHIGEHGMSMGQKLQAGGAAVTGLGAALQMIGSKDKQAMDQLKASVQAAGGNWETYHEEVEKTIKTQENYGHSAVDTQNALRVLVQATGSTEKATSSMSVVANLAAARHISLADAASMVAKIYAGAGSRTLKQYGVNMDSAKEATAALTSATTRHEAAVTALHKAQRHLTDLEAIDHAKKKLSVSDEISLRNARAAVKDATANVAKTTDVLSVAQRRQKDSTHAAEDALTQLNGKLSGQAKASVDNFAGRIDVIKTKIGDWVAVMSQKAGPVVTALGPVLMVAGAAMQIVATRNAAAAATADAEATATLRQVVASKVAAVASKGWAAAQWLLNAALTANPIGLVVVAIAALIAIFVVAWKHSETFRNIVKGALHDVLAVFQAVWGWIKGNWPLLLVLLTGPVGLAVKFIVDHFGQILGFVRSMPGKIASAAQGMWHGITDAFRAAINGLISLWNHLHFSLGGWTIPVPLAPDIHVPRVTVGVPPIPYMAKGGIVRRPTLAMIGEAGPEAVIPLSRMPAASGAVEVHVHFDGIVGDPIAAGRQVVQVLDKVYSGTGVKPAFAR